MSCFRKASFFYRSKKVIYVWLIFSHWLSKIFLKTTLYGISLTVSKSISTKLCIRIVNYRIKPGCVKQPSVNSHLTEIYIFFFSFEYCLPYTHVYWNNMFLNKKNIIAFKIIFTYTVNSSIFFWGGGASIILF